jgi:hypothetical protein
MTLIRDLSDWLHEEIPRLVVEAVAGVLNAASGVRATVDWIASLRHGRGREQRRAPLGHHDSQRDRPSTGRNRSADGSSSGVGSYLRCHHHNRRSDPGVRICWRRFPRTRPIPAPRSRRPAARSREGQCPSLWWVHRFRESAKHNSLCAQGSFPRLLTS